MSRQPLASIIVNNYNYGRFLPDAIDGALCQIYTNTEVIVVDDGSTDSSREVIACYQGRVRAILKENGGQGSTFNAGFAASRGEVVVFLDADDVLLPTALERAIPLFDSADVVKVHWPLWIVDEQCRHTGRMCPGPNLAEGDLRQKVFRLGPTNHLSAPGCGNAWARPFLERVLPLPETLYRNGCDTYLFELAPFFGRLRTLSEPQTLYRQHGKNDHLSFPIEEKVQRELRFYEHYCGVLARYCEGVGVKVDLEAWRRNSWWHRHAKAIEAIKRLPELKPIILVDDGTLEVGLIGGRQRIPFLERNGASWGPPADDGTAVSELERLRRAGAGHIVFAWPAFWWLDHYAEFLRYLRAHYAQVLSDDCLVVFDLSTTPAVVPAEGLSK